MIKKLLFVITLLSGFSTAYAQNNFDQCFNKAAQMYSVDPILLKAIAKTESSFNPRAINRNANGSEDVGIMQINSSWLPTLGKYGITRDSLFHACTNIHVGAWVLSSNFTQMGKSWKAVGAYNSPNPYHQQIYVSKVLPNYLALQNNKF